MPVALHPSTVALDHVPLCASSLTDTPPPVSKLKSSTASHASATVESVSMPEPGQEFCGFEMLEELGSGTFARVYLAKQSALADRQVAVKVTLKPTKEPERIARLQHTNVVPVYSVHELARAQVICMPYLGRRTLADAITGHRRSHAAAGLSTRKAMATKKGSSVAGSRTRIGQPLAPRDPLSDPKQPALTPDNPLVGKVEAVLVIMKQLADGLDHAHSRGVLHLDLKPANVLIADTGEPMLLDFNLSFAEAEGKRELVGGTIPYMAPEQLLDLQKRGKGRIDARTDLYSLGVMAFELLTGKHPFPVTSKMMAEFDPLIAARNAGAPRLRSLNPDVPAAVESIVAKLLEPNPDQRYQTARDLREDVDRQLNDRPLKFAADRSIPERVGKWRRRNPKLMVACLVVAALSLAGGAGAFAFDESEKRELREAESRVRETHDGLASARLDLLLPDPATRARGMKQAVKLLGAFDLPQDPNWRKKPAFQRVPKDQQAALAADVGELLLLVAQARVAEGKADRAGAANDARILNELARDCFGDDAPPMLAKQRAALDDKPAPDTVAKTARDYFLDGAALFVATRFDAAVRPLEKAVVLQPDHGAAQFLLARCRHHVGQFEAAIERYKSAAALLPNDPRPLYFTGVALGLSGRHAASEEAFSEVIEADRNFGDAYQARGVSRMEQRADDDAEADFTQAMDRGASQFQCLNLRALVRSRTGDRDGADADRTALAKLAPVSDADYVVRGYTRIATAPREAVKDFEKALELNPASLNAHRNRVHVLADVLRDHDAALKAATEQTAHFPEHAVARAQRALCLARLGKHADALVEVQACRKLLEAKGSNDRDPMVLFRLARVYGAMGGDKREDREAAIRLVKDAIRSGFANFQELEKERDLATIRDLPEFKRAVEAARELSN
ncbi:MAG: serine/threonine-protein kinase [Gemmataceae bacterium]